MIIKRMQKVAQFNRNEKIKNALFEINCLLNI